MSGAGKAREVWDLVKEKLILSNIALPIVNHDLSVVNRDVTLAAAADIRKHKVGVKCATSVSEQ